MIVCSRSGFPRHTANMPSEEVIIFLLSATRPALILHSRLAPLVLPRTFTLASNEWTMVTLRHPRPTLLILNTLLSLSTRRSISERRCLGPQLAYTLPRSLNGQTAGEVEVRPRPSSMRLNLRIPASLPLPQTTKTNPPQHRQTIPTPLTTSTLSNPVRPRPHHHPPTRIPPRTPIFSRQCSIDSLCLTSRHLSKHRPNPLSIHSSIRLRPSSRATGSHQYPSNQRRSIGRASTIADIPRSRSRLRRSTPRSSRRWRRV